ncbi:MAG: amidohydrolase [Chloroflexi bacterium]|nr:amidohydrolase [Chloroflexota bacterium]
MAPKLVAWRRDFHQHPELSFQEFRTAEIVARHLDALGAEVTTGVGKTGVVGVIEGNGPGPVVLLRFDMDALPVNEATGLPFASQHPGIMHACGHDGHTAIGMGVAEMLSQTRDAWPGAVKFLFQPAEEEAGGARATIRDGVLENPRPDAAFALHLWNQFPLGMLVVQPGPLMAASDHFVIVITGRGGHGAVPEETIDAVLVGIEAANALHHIVSRNISPHDTAVLSIGSFRAGKAFNVIAEEVIMEGTLRTFDLSVRERLIGRMEEVLAGVTAMHGASYRFEVIENEYAPPVINDERMTAIAYKAARRVVAEEQITQITPIMVAEDMSEILNRVPGCYIMLGAEPEDGARGPHHNPRFDINEDALPIAAAVMASVAVEFLNSSTAGESAAIPMKETS